MYFSESFEGCCTLGAGVLCSAIYTEVPLRLREQFNIHSVHAGGNVHFNYLKMFFFYQSAEAAAEAAAPLILLLCVRCSNNIYSTHTKSTTHVTATRQASFSVVCCIKRRPVTPVKRRKMMHGGPVETTPPTSSACPLHTITHTKTNNPHTTAFPTTATKSDRRNRFLVGRGD